MSKPPVVPSLWVILSPILLLLVLAIILPLLVPTGPRPPDEAWKGFLYSNANDPAVLVPKRYGIGYTLNFGNPWSWAVLIFVLLMAALPLVFSAMTVRHLSR
jgi:hypothetical protein